MKKNLFKLAICILAASLLLVGCGTTATTTATTAAATTKAATTAATSAAATTAAVTTAAATGAAPTFKKVAMKDVKIGLVYSIAIPFFNPCDAAAADIGKELGIKISIEKPPKATVDEQIKIIENLITQGVNGLVICSVGAGIDPTINAAIKQGIPVFMFAVDNVNSNRLAYFGTDQKDYSEKAAKYMSDLIGGKGVVAGNGGVSTAPDQLEREKYFKEYMAKNTQIKVADIQYGNNDPAKTLSNIEGMLNTHKPNGFWAFNSMSGGTLASVIKDYGKDKIKTLADNDYPDIIKGVREGYLDATLTQAPYTMAYEAIKKMTELLVDGKMPEKKFYFTDTVFLTKANLDQYFNADNTMKAYIKSALK